MPATFNPPPGWPPAPQGWLPSAGWQPDPSWPPPPEGWQFVLDQAAEDPQTTKVSEAQLAGPRTRTTSPELAGLLAKVPIWGWVASGAAAVLFMVILVAAASGAQSSGTSAAAYDDGYAAGEYMARTEAAYTLQMADRMCRDSASSSVVAGTWSWDEVDSLVEGCQQGFRDASPYW